jgi:hypothetical protein
MSRYYTFKGSGEKYLGIWRRILRGFICFDPFAVAQNVRITNLPVVEEAGNKFFKINFFNFSVAANHEVPQKPYDK